MELNVFVIFDSGVGAYLQPFFSQSKGAAIRAVQVLVDDSQHNFNKYAQDFTLFHLGTWSDSDSKFVLNSAPVSVISFHELKSKKEES